MLKVLRTVIIALVVAPCILAAGIAETARAQDYPTRPVRFIVANNAGSPPDIIARIMASEMAKFLGQPVVVENKPGADNIVG